VNKHLAIMLLVDYFSSNCPCFKKLCETLTETLVRVFVRDPNVTFCVPRYNEDLNFESRRLSTSPFQHSTFTHQNIQRPRIAFEPCSGVFLLRNRHFQILFSARTLPRDILLS